MEARPTSTPRNDERPSRASATAVVARSVGFLALAAALFIALGAALHAFGISLHTQGTEEGPKSFLNTLALCVIGLCATAFLARLERRSTLSFGLGDARAGVRWTAGVVTGVGLFAILLGVLFVTDAIRFDHRPAGVSSPAWGLFWFVSYMGVAAAEEVLFRGYLLWTLASRFGTVVGIAATSLLFGLAHLSNGLESPQAAINAVLLGGVLAWSIQRSGSLWWAIGLHGGWNWAESYLAGAADSGLRAMGRLVTAHPLGTAVWSGGSAGPEGSVLMLLPVVLASVACAVTFPGDGRLAHKHVRL